MKIIPIELDIYPYSLSAETYRNETTARLYSLFLFTQEELTDII